MSKYFSFLRKKRSPSLTDDAGEVIGSSISPGGKLRKHKGKKSPPHNVDDGFCDQRFSLQNYDFYKQDSEDVKVSSEGNSMHSDNDSLLDNLSYGEVCSSVDDKSLQWEKVETITDDSRPSSSSESSRLVSKYDSITLCENKTNNTSQEEDEGLAHERTDDYFSFDHKDLFEQVSLLELMEVGVGSQLIDDFMDEAFDDIEGVDEDANGDQSDINLKTGPETVCADESCVRGVSEVEIVNAVVTEGKTEAQTSDRDIVANVLEKMTKNDQDLATTPIDVTPQSNDVEGEGDIDEAPVNVSHSDNDGESSPVFISDYKNSSSDDIAPNDASLSNSEEILPNDGNEKPICDSVDVHHALDDVSTCHDDDDDADETLLLAEKSIGCGTELVNCEPEVICAVVVDGKENLQELMYLEDESKVLLEKDFTDDEPCVDASHDSFINNPDKEISEDGYDEPTIEADETEIKEALNSDFHSVENLEPAIENSFKIADDILLPIQRIATDEVIERDEVNLLINVTQFNLLANESGMFQVPVCNVSNNVKETVNPIADTKQISESLAESIISRRGNEYRYHEISPDKEISAIGEMEINLSTSELENLAEKIPDQCESQNFSNVISDKDIPQFPVENKNKAALGNSDRTTNSVSTGTYTEFDDEFDSAKEDLTDDEADIVYDTHDINLAIVNNSIHLSDSCKSEVFEATKEAEPSRAVLSDNKINEIEVGGDEGATLLIPNCVPKVEEEMHDVPDNACGVAIICDDRLDSLNSLYENACEAKNIRPDYHVSKEADALEEDNCSAVDTDVVVANCNQNNSEVVGTVVQSTTVPVVICDNNEIVIACDEALLPISSSQINLDDSIAKDFDTTESSVETNCTIAKDDSDLLDEESVFPYDVSSSSVANEIMALQGTTDDGIEVHDVANSDNELLSTPQRSNDNSSSSNSSKKHSTTVSSDENFLFEHSDHVEAEARLAQRRAARAEARELRLRELEKQQLDQDDNEDEQQYAANSFAPADKKLQNAAQTPPRTNTPYFAKSSPRGVSVARASAGRSSSLANSTGSGGGGGQFSRRSSEDSTPDDALPLSSRELKVELKELEEKFRKAMITNAQLDNEKATLTYEVEFMKDKYSDLEESHNQLTKDHRKKCSENETLRKLTNKLKEEVKMVRKVLQERDSLIQEYGLVLIGEENGEENHEDHDHDEEMEDDTINDLSPRKIGVKKALLSTEASELLAKGAAQGSLDVRLKKYAERKNDLEDEVRRLKLELEEELSKRRKENGLDYEKQKEASKSINEYKFRVQKAEAEVSTLQANVARLESLVTRYKASSEELEKSEEDLKSEKRRLQRELREAQNRLEELELTTSHLQKRFDKLKTARSTLLKDLSQDLV